VWGSLARVCADRLGMSLHNLSIGGTGYLNPGNNSLPLETRLLPPINSWRVFALGASAGTFTLTQGAVTTAAINFNDTIVYHLGDTCLFSDLELVGKHHPIDLALMCIGGHYTMDRWDAVEAARLVGAKAIIPCHYNTFPPIEADAEAFKADVQNAGFSQVTVLEPGGTHTVR
jgi:L-ascorbate metabolism protein UlaG (beta-lactamase superfamily)